MSVVVDSSALLAVVQRERGAEAVESVEGDLIVSPVILAETLSIAAERGFDVAAVEQDLMNMGLKIYNVVDEDVRRVVEMHGLAKLNISLADRFCLALAQRLGLPTLTGDRAWARLELPIEVRLFR